MPFLHWFKKTPASAETETDTGEKLDIEPAVPAPVSPDAPDPEQQKLVSDTEPLPETTVVEPVAISESAELPTPAEDSPAERPPSPYLSVAIGAFYEKLPAHSLTAKRPNLTRTVQIAEEDAVIDHETKEATLPLSILSLSCPEIFARPVEPSEDAPITFSIAALSDLAQTPARHDSLSQPEESPHPGAHVSGAQPETSDAVPGTANEIKVRLQPIIADFPHDLEPQTIHSLAPTEAEVSLPLDTIKAQLRSGRVAVPASTFVAGLPADLKPLFATIDPAAEIPIPLREIFSRLPADAIEIRKDQESDHPEDKVATPFSEHAAEDAIRFTQPSAEKGPRPEAAPQKVEQRTSEAVAASDKLQAIFMTDEPLDLAAALRKVTELPGLQSCALSTTDGLKLAGGLGDPNQEKLVSTLLPELFERTQSVFHGLRTGALEAITIYTGANQFSAFVRGKICLTIVHDNRPFKPGVREKIQVVLNELEALSATAKPS